MTYVNTVLIALGVSADAFAVALGRGLTMRRLFYRDAALIAITFGLFQAAMPLIGWLLGSQLEQFIAPVDHWIAFALLAAVGGKLLWDAFHGDEEKREGDGRISPRQLLVLAFATSIDALAVGIGLAIIEVPILPAIAIIGVTTAVLSFGGVLLGHRAGVRFRTPAEVVGGLVLIGIGTKILFDHLLA